jgi:hypothetical protein
VRIVVGGPENEFMAREQELARVHNLTLEDAEQAQWLYARHPVDLRYSMQKFTGVTTQPAYIWTQCGAGGKRDTSVVGVLQWIAVGCGTSCKNGTKFP